ncbi:hypothetical protein LCGC14_0050440 [marine sediment metagenome]|uniref:Uncharacterized protein n=1 Tax=marine sediment metagenome TaxID=412755 RepID=A0A0F9VRH1_9ZZZZ|nr:hypothetical protein [Maribacter sp.]HDZ06856.1 hypothetical protein [Maribacter sp.]HEA81036.1 hypothetical protein [Maribacter sp.]
MNLNVDNSEQLMQVALDDLLFDKLMYQIEKDFVLVNIPLGISDRLNPIEFIALIKEKVYYLMMERFGEYLNLMYIIDIPETEFKNLEITDAVDVSDQVTFLILKREYKKVWYRNKYK